MTLAVGMRVVVTDGDWLDPRMVGHYGKITEIVPWAPEDHPRIRVDITGHVDGQSPYDFVREEWYWWFPEELEVVD